DRGLFARDFFAFVTVTRSDVFQWKAQDYTGRIIGIGPMPLVIEVSAETMIEAVPSVGAEQIQPGEELVIDVTQIDVFFFQIQADNQEVRAFNQSVGPAFLQAKPLRPGEQLIGSFNID